MLLAFVIACGLGPLTPSVSRADETPVQATITAENCREDASAVPSVSYTGARGENIHNTVARGRFIARGVYRFTIAVAPGHQQVLLQTANCDANMLLSTLSGHNRQLRATLTELLPLYLTDCSLAGTLPPGVVAITLRAPREQDLQADIDEGAYYADHIWPVKYTLRVRLTNGKLVAIPLELDGGVHTHQACDQLFTHDITTAELSKASKSQSQP